MTTRDWAFETQNAKRMTSRQVAESFVVPPAFRELTAADHCYIIGPRGSGKTTLLKMLQGESLTAWSDPQARRIREAVNYSTIFLPADELWASQNQAGTGRSAFTAQLLYAFVETVLYRCSKADSNGNPVHLPVDLSREQQAELVRDLSDGWRVPVRGLSLLSLMSALDIVLTDLTGHSDGKTPFDAANPIALLSYGIRSFNRIAGQPQHRWALLLDEMELAPGDLHREIVEHVRGGSEVLIVKVSMSPFDRYMQTFGAGGGPIPGHDLRTIHLSGQTRAERHAFTSGLWREAIKSRGLPEVSLVDALGTSTIVRYPGSASRTADRHAEVLASASVRDPDFAAWLQRRGVDLEAIHDMSYNERSSTVRKIYPLIVFRDAVLTFENGKPAGRSRKKLIEPFTGADAVISALEGNPRWIKTVFGDMLEYLDEDSMSVPRGFQFDALTTLANRFEALLRVLPLRTPSRTGINVMRVIDRIAEYFYKQNTGKFAPDPANCFVIDKRVPSDLLDIIVMGLYAGAIVHVRDRRSPAVLSDFYGQRFRLAYILGVRDNKEFPLRLGKDVALSRILSEDGGAPLRRSTGQPVLFETDV